MLDLRNRRVLVTGATGFLGANLVRRLLVLGADVHGVARTNLNAWRLEGILGEFVTHGADVADQDAVSRVINEVRPDIIFHLAAPRTSSTEDYWENVKTSVLGTASLLNAADSLDYTRFVHLGSSLEYGPSTRPLRETQLLRPVTIRGATKAAATLLCLQRARGGRRPVVVLRAFSVYGYWEDPGRLIPTAMRAALEGQDMALTAPGFRRDLVFVDDVVEAMLLSLNAPNVHGQVINVGSGQQWSNEQVVDEVQSVSGRKISLRVGAYPARSSDTGFWVADNRKARRLLGWTPRHSLREGLEKTFRWVASHPSLYLRPAVNAIGG